MTTDHEWALLSYYDRMIKHYRIFSREEEVAFHVWRSAGGKFTQWPMWEKILGPRPRERRKQSSVSIDKRKIA